MPPEQTGATAANIITAECRRELSPVAYAANRSVTAELPRDTVVKRIAIDLQGYAVTTYASGSPVASEFGPTERMCPRIDLLIDGQRLVKSISPEIQVKLNALYAGNHPRRAYRNGTTTSRRAATEAPSGAAFVYGATTEDLVINEHFEIHCEMPWAYGFGRESTMLQLKDVSSASLIFNFGSIESLLADGNSAPVVTSAIDFNFFPTLIEAREVPRDYTGFDFKESFTRYNYSGQVTDSEIQLPRGNGLAGVAMMARNGGSTRLKMDRLVRGLALEINGQQALQRIAEYYHLQDDNQCRYGANDPLASSDHSLEGFAFMNLLKNGDLRSALNTSLGAGVDQVRLKVTTASTSAPDAATYTTNPAELTVLAQEIAAVPKRVA